MVLGICKGSRWLEASKCYLNLQEGKKDLGNYKPVSLTSVPGKIMKEIVEGIVEKHLKDNAVIIQS